VIERLAQNLFICPSTIASMRRWPASSPTAWPNTNAAAPSSRPARPLHPALNAMGLSVPVMPDGAFYAWADCSQACERLGLARILGICL
jgi:aspartate/methionine/tyrosine aminotransferase